jgi:hypothetical protein
MSNYALTTFEQKQLALLHAHFTPGGGISTPFARDIFLLETHVAGTTHGAARRIEPTLLPGSPLVLRREPDNPYDEHAILILTEAGEKIGYIPRDRNEIPARLMDAGKSLFSRLDSKEWHGDWLQISARIFLKDL